MNNLVINLFLQSGHESISSYILYVNSKLPYGSQRYQLHT